MKKILSLILIISAFIITSCAGNPNDPNKNNDPDKNDETKITLAQRAGDYEGDMSGTTLKMIFDDKGQVTSILVGLMDFSTIGTMPVTVGDPNSTNKEYTFSVQMKTGGGTVNVKVVFDSDTEATGGTAYVDLTGTGFDENSPIIISKVS